MPTKITLIPLPGPYGTIMVNPESIGTIYPDSSDPNSLSWICCSSSSHLIQLCVDDLLLELRKAGALA